MQRVCRSVPIGVDLPCKNTCPKYACAYITLEMQLQAWLHRLQVATWLLEALLQLGRQLLEALLQLGGQLLEALLQLGQQLLEDPRKHGQSIRRSADASSL